MQDKVVTLVCIFSIVFLVSFALYKGIDGVALAVGIAAIAGLGGYTLKGFLK
jgi:hypothetical protein